MVSIKTIARERKTPVRYEPHTSTFVKSKKVMMTAEKVANSKTRKAERQRKDKERKLKKGEKTEKKEVLKVKIVNKKKKQ